MDELTPSERLDVGWAHLLQGATSGAFTNPYKVRAQMKHLVFGGPPPPPDEDDTPSPGVTRRGVTRRHSKIPADAMKRLGEAHTRLQELRGASLPPQ